MKRLVLITGVILISCVFISTVFAQPASAGASSEQEAAETGLPDRYVIRDSGGKIAVFFQGADKPFFVTETYTNSLPKADAARLKEGIEIDSEARLRKILEDYCS